MTYLAYFLIFNILTILVMKLIGHTISKQSLMVGFTKIYPKTSSISDISALVVLRNFLLSASFLCSIWQFYQYLFTFSPFESELLKSYFLVPFVYIFTFFLGTSIQAISLLFKEIPISIHNSPLKSKSIFEFWTIRWNVWIRDWLRAIGKKIVPSHKNKRVLFIFIVSGLFHEFMLTIPYYVSTGINQIGFMMVYFLIQFIGLYLDRKLIKTKRIRYVFMWCVLIIPAPFFINTSFIKLFGF